MYLEYLTLYCTRPTKPSPTPNSDKMRKLSSLRSFYHYLI